jgi:MFS family permease
MNIAALEAPSFRIYLFGNVFATHAIWMQRITFGWLAWSLSEQASMVGVVAFALFAPTMVTGPLFGVLTDRMDLRRAAQAVQGAQLALTLALLALHAAGALGLGALFALALATGVVTSAHHPVRMSLAPRLVPRPAVGSAVNIGSLNFNLARIVGPALGGWLIAQHGIATALAVQAAAFIPLQLALLRIEIAPREGPPPPREALGPALASGLRFVLGHRDVAQAMLVTGLVSLMGRGVLEILPAIADGRFGRGAAGLGALTAAAGAGAIVAGTAMAMLPGQTAPRLPAAAFMTGWAAVALVPVLGLATAWPLALAVTAAIGACATAAAVSGQTAVQLAVPDAIRARVMSLWVLTGVGAAALGALAMGLIADLAGLPATLVVAGGAAALGFAVLWPRMG